MQRMPLTGVRVITCAFMWAGPVHTRLLADLGAEVIKIEHHQVRGAAGKADGRLAPTWMASYPDGDPGESPWNRSGNRNQLYRGKLSLVLDLNSAKGKQIFLDLVKVSDVVQDNYSYYDLLD